MSHIVEIETELTDLAAVRAACKRLKWEFRAGQRRYRWFGKFMNDTPLPAGMTVADIGTRDHSIRVPGCRYEVGLARAGTVYKLRWDYFHGDRLVHEMGGPAGGRFLQAYAVEKARIETLKQGHTVTEQQLTDGSIKLTVRVGGTAGNETDQRPWWRRLF